MTLRNTLDFQARQHAAAVASDLQPVDVIVGALWRLIPPVLVVVAVLTGLAIAWRRYGLNESVGAHYLIEAQRAQHPPPRPMPVRCMSMALVLSSQRGLSYPRC
jgi:hypothetical protein